MQRDVASETPVAIPKKWIGVDDISVMAANECVVSISSADDGFILTFGHVAPPVFVGTDEEQREQAVALEFVPVRTLGRFYMSPGVLTALQLALSEMLERRESSGPDDE